MRQHLTHFKQKNVLLSKSGGEVFYGNGMDFLFNQGFGSQKNCALHYKEVTRDGEEKEGEILFFRKV